VTSGNAAFLHKTLFIWVALLAVLFLKERLGRAQIGALAALALAQYLLGGPGALRLDQGSAMVFTAALLWAVEVIVAKQVLAYVSSIVAATSRMALGAVILLVYLAAIGDFDQITGLSGEQWAWALATSVILFGYVTTWYAALQRAPATAVTCVLVLGAPITAGLDAIAGHGLPDAEQWAGYAVLVLAVAAIAALATTGPGRRIAPQLGAVAS
jgi:drug/metabolite transporter (DMT)-like permease